MIAYTLLAAPARVAVETFHHLRGMASRALGYDAVQSTNKRRSATGVLNSEDAELTIAERRKLIQQSRDITRNFSLVKWAVNKHLDYVSTFRFQGKTGNKELDKKIEKIMQVFSQPENCDIARRHDLSRLIRLLEARRAVDGDILLVKLQNMKLQAVEGDRIRTPDGGLPGQPTDAQYIHGVQVDKPGAAVGYVVCKRMLTPGAVLPSSAFEFERVVKADNAWLHAYWDRIDQTRGISPLASALNSLQDAYEATDYALAKMKVSQLFGILYTRKASDGFPVNEEDEEDEDEDEEQDDCDASRKREHNFGNGPVEIELDIGEDAKMIESQQPSTQFQAFMQTVIALVLKALDIPYSFYAENFSNYSGSRQALLQYEQSASIKRRDNRSLLNNITRWVLQAAIDDGTITEVSSVDELSWYWAHAGLPWIDPLKEVAAAIQALSAGLTSRQRIAAEWGEDIFDIFDELATENAYMLSVGLNPVITPGNIQISEVAPQQAA